MTNATLSIHASSLDGFLDCPRRAVAEKYPHLLKDAGYEVRDPIHYVTPLVGNGIHAGADFLNTDYIRTGLLPTVDLIRQAADVGFAEFEKKLMRELENHEVKLTAKFASNDVIRHHIGEYVNLYANTVLPTRKLELTEQYFKVEIKPGFQFSSTLDGYGDATLFDLKTGDQLTPAFAQIGTYVYLLRNAGYEVKFAQLDYVTKATPGRSTLRDTPHHVVIKYNADDCMKIAQYATARLISDLENFMKTKDINVLLVNPRSESCNQLMCKLYNTGSCGGWRKNYAN